MTTSDFRSDLEAATSEINAARSTLVSGVQRLSGADLERARRGGWAVRRVLEHVIQSEHLYVTLIAALRGLPVAEQPAVSCAGRRADEILRLLDSSRSALLSALDGVDEESFYTIKRFGHEEYSVLSVLENLANHDREHAGQIAAIISS